MKGIIIVYDGYLILISGSTNNRQWFHNWQINQNTIVGKQQHTWNTIQPCTPSTKSINIMQCDPTTTQCMWYHSSSQCQIRQRLTSQMSVLRNNNSSSQIMQCMWRIHPTTTYICNYRISVYPTSPLRPSISYNNNQSSRTVLCIIFASTRNTSHFQTYHYTPRSQFLLLNYQATGVKMIKKR